MPAPHGVPLGVLSDSMHTGVPVLHAVVPVRHGLSATTQLDPATHIAHAALGPHTRSVPQEVPGATALPVSTHAGMLPEQSSAPVWQGLEGVHDWPFTHTPHAPSWHTRPAPQGVPFG